MGAGSEATADVGAQAARYTALIMAGSRGAGDPFAQAFGVSHKCLVEVAGRPMLLRVVETLEASPCVAKIVLCVESSLQDIPSLEQRLARGTVARLDAAASPAASALRACEALADELPVLVVTADHPLLSVDMIDYFCARAPACGDIAAGVARGDLVRAAYPQSTRTLLRFADADYCGCNIFALNTLGATAALSFWTMLEAERKHPWRLVRMLGLVPLLRYWRGRLELSAAVATLSSKLGIEAGTVEMPFAEAAIDVDKQSDFELVESIIEKRPAGPSGT